MASRSATLHRVGVGLCALFSAAILSCGRSARSEKATFCDPWKTYGFPPPEHQIKCDSSTFVAWYPIGQQGGADVVEGIARALVSAGFYETQPEGVHNAFELTARYFASESSGAKFSVEFIDPSSPKDTMGPQVSLVPLARDVVTRAKMDQSVVRLQEIRAYYESLHRASEAAMATEGDRPARGCRDSKLDLIHDSTPARSFPYLTIKSLSEAGTEEVGRLSDYVQAPGALFDTFDSANTRTIREISFLYADIQETKKLAGDAVFAFRVTSLREPSLANSYEETGKFNERTVSGDLDRGAIEVDLFLIGLRSSKILCHDRVKAVSSSSVFGKVTGATPDRDRPLVKDLRQNLEIAMAAKVEAMIGRSSKKPTGDRSSASVRPKGP